MVKLRGSSTYGFAGLFAIVLFVLLILGMFAILALIGLLVFKASLALGIGLIFGILVGIFAPWWWIKVLGGLLTLGVVIAALLMILG
jgi:hypothetical protein